MKLKPDEKFVLPSDDGSLILITEIDFDYSVLQNKVMPMKGIEFEVDYGNNEISNSGKVEVQTSFTIDGICGKDD